MLDIVKLAMAAIATMALIFKATASIMFGFGQRFCWVAGQSLQFADVLLEFFADCFATALISLYLLAELHKMHY